MNILSGIQEFFDSMTVKRVSKNDNAGSIVGGTCTLALCIADSSPWGTEDRMGKPLHEIEKYAPPGPGI